jgi:hypothetical protein
MSSQDWQARLVASLCRSKQRGYSWARAREIAEFDIRLPEPVVPMELFPSVDGESAVEAMWRFCEDAWHGRRPGLEQFTMGLLAGEDETRSARRGRSMRRTA